MTLLLRRDVPGLCVSSEMPFCLDPEDIGGFAVNTPLLMEHDGIVKMLFIASLDGDNHERNYDLWLMPSSGAQPVKVLEFNDCVHNPWIVKEKDFVRLYITVMEHADDPSRYRSAIHAFRSRDLKVWEHEDEIITGDEFFPEVEGASVIKRPDGKYVGYFTVAAAGDAKHPRFSENYTIFYALSDDGIHFGEWQWPDGLESVQGESDRGMYAPKIYPVGPSDYCALISVVPWIHRFFVVAYRSRDLHSWSRIGQWTPKLLGQEKGVRHVLKATLFRGHFTYAMRDNNFRTWIRTESVNLSDMCPEWEPYFKPFNIFRC
jgi:hypothetical protein